MLIAGVALTALALFTMVDIVLRYIFNQPISGSIDVVKLALVVMTFCALPYAGRSDGHIVVDIVPDYPSPRLNRVRDAAGKLLTAAIFAVLAWQGLSNFCWLGGSTELYAGFSTGLGVS